MQALRGEEFYFRPTASDEHVRLLRGRHRENPQDLEGLKGYLEGMPGNPSLIKQHNEQQSEENPRNTWPFPGNLNPRFLLKLSTSTVGF